MATVTIQEIVSSLPERVQETIEAFKTSYSILDPEENYEEKARCRCKIAGYARCLMEVGLVNEIERQRICTYMTI